MPALLRACGGVAAAHDPLVAGRLSARVVDGDPLLPGIFEAEGAGRALCGGAHERPRWTSALNGVEAAGMEVAFAS
ncbi:hypothetical protein ACIBI9_36915 [Nonomuraea sp. NPDC050451]|uniref:hypothetical protein n=1 Tax=Nonomuraea sp. NPDC050451 TaxID=3364364 RepID=UPI003791FD07